MTVQSKVNELLGELSGVSSPDGENDELTNSQAKQAQRPEVQGGRELPEEEQEAEAEEEDEEVEEEEVEEDEEEGCLDGEDSQEGEDANKQAWSRAACPAPGRPSGGTVVR